MLQIPCNDKRHSQRQTLRSFKHRNARQKLTLPRATSKHRFRWRLSLYEHLTTIICVHDAVAPYYLLSAFVELKALKLLETLCRESQASPIARRGRGSERKAQHAHGSRGVSNCQHLCPYERAYILSVIRSKDVYTLVMQVKLRLAGKDAHDSLVQKLADSQQKLYAQENFFFDGANAELSSKRCVMRLRFFNTDEKAVITVKGKMTMVDGVGRAMEEEEAVDPKIARRYQILAFKCCLLLLVCLLAGTLLS